MFDNLPEPLQQVLTSAIVATVLAWLGRMMWHVAEVQKQRRRFWSPHLIWELVTAIAIGFVADGVAEWLGLSGKPAMGVIIAIAYLGPRGVQSIIITGLRRYAKPGRKL